MWQSYFTGYNAYSNYLLEEENQTSTFKMAYNENFQFLRIMYL